MSDYSLKDLFTTRAVGDPNTELTEEMLSDAMKQLEHIESPSEILIPKSLIDRYGKEAIVAVLNSVE